MSQFKVEKERQGDTLVLHLHGQIDEDASFENVEFDGASSIELDLNEVSAINSCGIREWIKWIRKAPQGSQLAYRNCPKVIVDQINMVAGFLPDNGKVLSFYVPYFCEESGNEKMVLFKADENFKEGSITPPPEIKDDETGELMEMDVIEAKYFKFITG